MTEPTTQQPQISNELLRFLISEAVQREVLNVVAPLRSQIQVLDGKQTQFNRDIGSYASTVEELNELVRGNPKQNLVGLADQIKQQNVLIADINTKLATAERDRSALRNQLQGAKYALSALAIVTGIGNFESIGRLLGSIFP